MYIQNHFPTYVLVNKSIRADEIKINVDVAIDILNNLLLYEKHDGGLMELEQQECPGVVLVHDVFKSFAIQARAKYIPSFNYYLPRNDFLSDFRL